MASTNILFLVILSLISQSLQDLDNNEIDVDINPYKEAAEDIRKEQNAQTIGGTLRNVLDGDGGNLIGGMLSQFAKENSGQLLQGLSAILASQTDSSKNDADSPNVLESLGILMSSFQGKEDGEGQGQGTSALLQGLGSLLAQGGQEGQGLPTAALIQGLGSLLSNGDEKSQGRGEGAASLLRGLGSLLTQGDEKNRGQGQGTAALLQGLGSILGQGNQNGQGGFDPALIGTLVNLFSESDKKKDVPIKRSESKKQKKQLETKPEVDTDFNFNDVLTIAKTFLGSGDSKGKKSQEGSFMALMPTILQTINSFMGPEAESRSKSHEGHSWLMPPFVEKLHIFFDHFIHSELGKKVIAGLGAEKSFKVFLDEKGRFSYKKFGEMMENHSYRRQWIRVATDRIAKFLQYASEPRVYKSYLAGGQLFFNSYIKSQGFPKAAMFDPGRPIETISAFINYAAKKYFEININSKEYVKPTVAYVRDLLKLAEKRGTLQSFSDSDDLSNKLADTINLDIIEPLARVNRAYRYARSVPTCERYVMCLVNQETQNEVESLPGLKKLLYKGSSLLAGWFLSAQTGTPFWTLYTDITENVNCKNLYINECSGFHDEELRVTTEYVHNEL